MFRFVLPDLGEGVHEGEILKWYVSVGDTIEADADLVEIETDKAAVEIPSPVAGKVVKLNGEVGDVVHVGDVIAEIDTGGTAPSRDKTREQSRDRQGAGAPADEKRSAEKRDDDASARERVLPDETAENGETAKPAPAGRERTAGPVPAAPATRRLARELGVDINEIEGSGPAGRVTPEDVQAFAKGETPARREAKAEEEEREPRAPRATGAPSGIPFFDPPPMPDFSKFGPVETEAFRSIRRKIAYRLATSAILIPHVPHLDEADVTELDKLRMEERERLADVPGGRLTLMPFLMRAVVSALKAYPRFNTSLDPDREELVYKKYYNVGVAADSPKGLVVPVVKDADRKSILELSAAIYDVGTRARDDKLEAADFQGGTFTITNIGPLGGLFAPPIINYPEVAILGVYKVQDKPVVRDGRIVIRKMMPIAVCFDHRVNDGADAARFLNHIIALIENPRRLLVEG